MPQTLRVIQPHLLAAAYPADRQPVITYLSRLGAVTAVNALCRLTTMARLLSDGRLNAHTLSWSALRYHDTMRLRAALLARYPNRGTFAAFLATLKGVLAECRRLELLSADEFLRATDWPRARVPQQPVRRTLSDGELSQLFVVVAADQSLAGARDLALLAMLLGTGLRRAELADLRMEDYDRASGAVQVRSGKGGKPRLASLPTGFRPLLTRWVEARGLESGPFFRPVHHRGGILARGLSSSTIMMMLLRRAAEADLTDVTAHTFRRTYATQLHRAGTDLLLISQLLGHSSVQTTVRHYIQVNRDQLLRAAAVLRPPQMTEGEDDATTTGGAWGTEGGSAGSGGSSHRA